ncbi:hypothetical protein OGAPHI_002748 [Ogataea philodendri]|uniref:Uncharacterized protein n=1 Tax=Ogataea philodendri TaxID=1378263 RepID=A0A9P8PB30_9ASCO|nr:uncharacterized protein OGAPHI_002748 [Ogataea philodendri]KAH3668993.1 hypothetical protein OGAPHI_002748 [Ogataea philodendri]
MMPAFRPVFNTTISTIPLQDIRTPTESDSRLYSPQNLAATNPPKIFPTMATTTMQTIAHNECAKDGVDSNYVCEKCRRKHKHQNDGCSELRRAGVDLVQLEQHFAEKKPQRIHHKQTPANNDQTYVSCDFGLRRVGQRDAESKKDPPDQVVGDSGSKNHDTDSIFYQTQLCDDSGKHGKRSDAHGDGNKHHKRGELNWLQVVVIDSIFVPQTNCDRTAQSKGDRHVKYADRKCNFKVLFDELDVHLAANHEQ